MAKTNEELKALKQECESFKTKAKELSEDELNYVTGGTVPEASRVGLAWQLFFAEDFLFYQMSDLLKTEAEK